MTTSSAIAHIAIPASIRLIVGVSFWTFLFQRVMCYMSSLFNGISIVGSRGAEEQMRRIYAMSNIATVKNPESLGNITEVHLPRNTMGPYRAAIVALQDTISFGFRSLPKPARVSFDHTGPEARYKRDCLGWHGRIITSPGNS